MEAALEILIEAIESRAEEFSWTCTKTPDPGLWLEVGAHKVLLLCLPKDLPLAEQVVNEGKEAAFDQWIAAGEAGVVNIVMFCIAPSGHQDQPEWKMMAGQFERDDLVCRKLVWLPSSGLDNARNFLDRTFLARPWDMAVQQGPDELAALAESLAVPTEWMKRLMDSELDGADLLNALLEISDGELCR